MNAIRKSSQRSKGWSCKTEENGCDSGFIAIIIVGALMGVQKYKKLMGLSAGYG